MIIKCLICGKEKYYKPVDIKRGGGKYCGVECYGISVSRRQKGENNHMWKGNNLKKRGLHRRIESILGTPSLCEKCGKTEGDFEWANKSHQYKYDLSDWMRLCLSCHNKYDKIIYNIKKMRPL